jgi:hypothetical protein
MAEQEATPLEGDVTSLSSRTSTNEEACLSPSPESLDDPERKFKMGKFPARHVPDGRTSARTGLPFMAYKKPEAVAVNSKESGERILKDKKLQVRMSRNYYQGTIRDCGHQWTNPQLTKILNSTSLDKNFIAA